MRVVLILAAIAALPACATIIEGTSQDIAVITSPAGATCHMKRNGKQIASLTTPKTVEIQKTKHDINLVCTKEGYADEKRLLVSHAAGATAGNLLVGGLVGWAVDSAVGADNKYDERVQVSLRPVPETLPEAATE